MLDNRMNLLGKLPVELLAFIFTFFNEKSLCTAEQVSKHWNSIITTSSHDNDSLWKSLLLKYCSPIVVQSSRRVVVETVNWKFIFSQLYTRFFKLKQLIKRVNDLAWYKQLDDLILDSIASSSQYSDNNGIQNTINSASCNPWCSSGTTIDSSEEYAVYILNNSSTSHNAHENGLIIETLLIQPTIAFYDNTRVFTPKSIQFDILVGNNWRDSKSIFSSPIISCPYSTHQFISVHSKSLLIIGSSNTTSTTTSNTNIFIKIRFIGKRTRKRDNLYYVAMDSIYVLGKRVNTEQRRGEVTRTEQGSHTEGARELVSQHLPRCVDWSMLEDMDHISQVFEDDVVFEDNPNLAANFTAENV